ncbi:hypothetical protein [Spiroplasma endosymbiont of Stenodema calcarata]|uniref:hypothetical protein n=1 Tax=Spiroplasma endosymbiont of Stenodema calcarata TaxID=3139328 RepID=UPI003CCB038A
MNKRYLLIIKNEYLTTYSFYTLEEAKITAKNEKYYQTVIIDLENEVYSDIEKLKIMDPKRYNELFNKGDK